MNLPLKLLATTHASGGLCFEIISRDLVGNEEINCFDFTTIEEVEVIKGACVASLGERGWQVKQIAHKIGMLLNQRLIHGKKLFGRNDLIET